MSLLTDQEKQDIAETVVHMSFDINYAESIAHVCELAEAAVIKKLAGVSVEPVAFHAQDGIVSVASHIDKDKFLFTTEALAAARVQALEEAAMICDKVNDSAARSAALRIRALIGD